MEITVKRSGIVSRTFVDQGARGVLWAAEEPPIPFPIRRTYAMYGVSDRATRRGEHAHKTTDQVMFVIRGSLTLHLDDGESRQSLALTAAEPGVRLGPMLWHAMDGFSEDCVAIVLASAPYDEGDYIRDYDEFKKHAR